MNGSMFPLLPLPSSPRLFIRPWAALLAFLVVWAALQLGAARFVQAETRLPEPPGASASPALMAIEGGLVYVPDGPPVVATVVLAAGRVLAVGPDAAVPPGARRIDATGLVVTPGFIDAVTHVGVEEVSGERQTVDTDFRGKDAADLLHPAFQVIDGYNPRSMVVPITRAGGVTTVIVTPGSGLLAGQSAAVDMAGESVRDAVIRPSIAQYVRLDEETLQLATGTRGGAFLRLREVLDDARVYGARRAAFEENRSRPFLLSRLHLEALQPALRGEQPLVVSARRAADIEAVLRLADELKLKVILEGASEAWQVKEELAKRKVPVILDALENLPGGFESIHARADQAAILHRAGVPVILSTFHTHNVNDLWQEAGNAVRFGLDHTAAIRAVTEVPARAFGLTGYGRLEPGAVANVVLWSGDPLETTTQVRHVFIRGREMSLETRQTVLLRKYRTLPGQAAPSQPR